MLLEQATARNVSRAMRGINASEWEGDFKSMGRQVLKQVVENRLPTKFVERYARRSVGGLGVADLLWSGVIDPQGRFGVDAFVRRAGLGHNDLKHCAGSGPTGSVLSRPCAQRSVPLSVL